MYVKDATSNPMFEPIYRTILNSRRTYCLTPTPSISDRIQWLGASVSSDLRPGIVKETSMLDGWNGMQEAATNERTNERTN
jgi:hypothetical protein